MGKPSWVPDDATAAWSALINKHSSMVAECQLADAQLWGTWANSPAPEASFPSGPGAKLTAFQRLLLVQVTTVPENMLSPSKLPAVTAVRTPCRSAIVQSETKCLASRLWSMLPSLPPIMSEAAVTRVTQ